MLGIGPFARSADLFLYSYIVLRVARTHICLYHTDLDVYIILLSIDKRTCFAPGTFSHLLS